MNLAQKQNVVQSLRQEQIMTHQQIQALEFLSTPVLELQTMVTEEIGKNPILDADADAAKTETWKDDDEWLEKVMKLEEDSRFIKSSYQFVNVEENEKRQHYLESIEAPKTLQSYLLEQLRFFDITDSLHSCCEVVISGLNDDGYLGSHPADLAMVCGESLGVVNEAIDMIKHLDPVGVGAKDLREFLMIQLERSEKQDSLAYIIVRDYLPEIANNHLPAIARKLKISLAELNEVLEEIKTLNPRLNVDDVKPHEYIKEEVEVFEDDGEFHVKMVNDYLPSLYINKQYKQLILDPGTPKDVRDYVKEKIRSGVHLINSIIQRQTTILKTVNAIVAEQNDFFRHGTKHLKPMTMSHIAQRVGVHETTISRAVAGKYLKCKHGLLSLRLFFSTGYQAEDGSSVSNIVVKKSIKKLIDNEDVYSPLSDSKLALLLEKKGLKVARRTVAKYRESMGVFSSNLRRKYSVENVK